MSSSISERQLLEAIIEAETQEAIRLRLALADCEERGKFAQYRLNKLRRAAGEIP